LSGVAPLRSNAVIPKVEDAARKQSLICRIATDRRVIPAYDPTDTLGKRLFNILTIFAEFESDLNRVRIREGVAVALAKGELKDKKPKLSPLQSKKLRRIYDARDYSVGDLAELFKVSLPTIYHTLAWQPAMRWGSLHSVNGASYKSFRSVN
jgi:DNA invertase Pin-like site-specific DNA recombinase